jgi:hypothetical protein
MNVKLINKSNGVLVGTISQEDFQFLVDNLEEESSSDVDYFIDSKTIDFLADQGGSVPLLLLLRTAVGDTEGIDIGWQEG